VPTGRPIARKFARGSASIGPRSERRPKNAAIPARQGHRDEATKLASECLRGPGPVIAPRAPHIWGERHLAPVKLSTSVPGTVPSSIGARMTTSVQRHRALRLLVVGRADFPPANHRRADRAAAGRKLCGPAAAHAVDDVRRSRLHGGERTAAAGIDLEVYFDFNSAAITPQAEPQLRELGAALSDARLKGATISISGHTDGIGGNTFNKKLSERRAVMIKGYLVDNFQLSPADLRTVGYGKSRPKNKIDPNAPDNRRVEVVNLAPQARAQAQR
jgi:outer membrane protein OmpA-like peptidoglycan-associated protein